MTFFKYVIATVLFLCINGQNCEREGIEYHLGTKTPYRLVANKNHSLLEYEGCTPAKVWMLVRHGTRNPNTKLIDKFHSRLPEIRDLIIEKNPNPTETLLASDLESFNKWASEIEAKDQKKLTVEGKREMVDLAERMQARLPKLFSNVYSNTSYQFKYTFTQRTKKSAKFFAVGLFGKQTAKDVWYPEALKKDPILRFYKLCKKWRSSVSKNPESLKERTTFDASTYMTKVVEKINKKLNTGNELSFADIHAMYTTCAFETAWHKKKKSPWCTPFDEESAKIMEYAEDLKYYWVDGYGYDLTHKQACPAFKDMMHILESEEKYPLSTVYFTHSGTLLKMLAHLGLYKDQEPLRAANFEQNMKQRMWKVSNIDAFGTNLAFVNYKCGEKSKMLVLHQEKVVRLPSCPNSDLCDFDEVKTYYKDSMENCDFDNMCSI